MTKYKLQGSNESNGVVDTENNRFIPNNAGNRHWFEYEQWKLGLDTEGISLTGNPGIQTPDTQFTLTEIKNNKKIELRQSCELDILSGFVSSATGTNYTYESSLKDQFNLSGAAQANVTLDYTVIDDNGDKIRVSHTNTQMNQAFIDGMTAMQTKITKLYTLLDQLANATDEIAVVAIVYV